ncbi:DctP family TRAP transporter solute-binding subunit [Virgibacillus sp. DJP39]|uniref:DctP family TRAP transporter solute-binding subunit n=1 Tax=Virgibacillus sp. DJP39 TaxID=3409790 RepID=UPI003BB71737
MHFMKKGILSLLILLLAIVITACGEEANSTSDGEGGQSDGKSNSEIQELTVKFSHVVAENTPKHQGALAFKEFLEEKSDGKIEVQVYPNSSLFGDNDEVDNLTANNVQFIAPDLSKFVGMNPAFNVPSLPFLFGSNEEAYAFWDGKKGQEVLSSLEDQGIIGLRMWPNGPKQITNNKHPIKTPEDLDGMKIRVQGGQVLASVYETLGAGPLQLPFGELYTALEQGTVDAQINTFSNIATKKLGDVQGYMTTNWGATRVDYAVFTNKEFWSSLNEPTKKLFEDAIEKATETERNLAEKLNKEAMETLKERGNMEIYELTTEERQVFLEALKPVYDEYADKIGQDVIDAAREAAAN